MTGSILWMDEGSPCRWRLAKAGGRRDGAAGRIADILFGDFDRARAEAAVRALRRSLPANEILIVRSGCEALEHLRQREAKSGPDRPARPVLMLLDEDLSGMAGHSILRVMRRCASPDDGLILLLVGAGRVGAHRQWAPEPDGYLEKPFAFRRLRDCIRSLGESAVPARVKSPQS
jgi:DNA-binding response OmpR family regulator